MLFYKALKFFQLNLIPRPLGDVNFDSVIIIDFGNSLKSVLTSLVFTDVDQKRVLFTTVNQWFDESIFYENTVKRLYYPSVNYSEFKKYKDEINTKSLIVYTSGLGGLFKPGIPIGIYNKKNTEEQIVTFFSKLSRRSNETST